MIHTNDQTVFIPLHSVLKRYGIVSRTLDRWLKSEELNFPRPVMLNARKRVWTAESLTEWEIERATRSIAKPPTFRTGHSASVGAAA